MADKDGFTNCYNKDWFMCRKNSKLVQLMKWAQATDSSFGIFFIDIDNFKPYNDRYGHVEGDKLLLRVVNSIKGSIRSRRIKRSYTLRMVCRKDFIVRFGGDEFCIICYNVRNLKKVAQRIVDNMEIDIPDLSISIGCSMFVGWVGDEKEVNVDILVNKVMKRTDDAMYEAKKVEGYSIRIAKS